MERQGALAASPTARTAELIRSGTCSWSVRMSVYRVPIRPKPSEPLIQTAKDSPTVAHRFLMIQNQTVISGTLFSITRAVPRGRELTVVCLMPKRSGKVMWASFARASSSRPRARSRRWGN